MGAEPGVGRTWDRLMMELLEQALTEEFDGEVIFAPWLPPTITPPAVVVAPGRPFLVPSTHGGVTETWRVMVAVSIKEPRLALSQIRGLALRTRKAAQSRWSGLAGFGRTRPDRHHTKSDRGLHHGDRIPLPSN